MSNEAICQPIKIDLITLQGVQNYGSVLQAFATQTVFEELGAQVTVINYVKEANRWDNVSRNWSHGNLAKALAIAPTVVRWKKVFQGFNDRHLHLTEQLYTTDEDFSHYNSDADAYCTGSDQVWNSKWNCGILSPLYLSFVPAASYKFAFSASFGQSHLSNEEVQVTESYIKDYRHISVRENSALTILREQYGYKNAIQTVDPTLCMRPEYWRSIAVPAKISGDYMLIYNLNKSRAFDDYAVALSKRTGMKLVRLCTRYDQFYRPGKSMLVPTVEEFIGLIDQARYVLTDSFHCTAFSMNMGTEPICVYPQEFNGRLASFLELTQSVQRQVLGYDDFDIVNRPVDFELVASILDGERAKARDYLNMVFSEIREGIDG